MGLHSTLAALTAASGLAAVPVSAADLERHVLRNGLELILASMGAVPLVTVEVAIRAGAFIETPDLDGLTHLHEHMFFKANRAFPDQAAYLRRLDELGMSWNGSTSHEVVRYHFTLPSGLLRQGLEFMSDAIQSPLFLPQELEKERQVVLGEYDRHEATPSFHLRRAVEKALFSVNYSRKNVIGDRQVIATATREKLQFIQDHFYVPANAALLVVGQFDPAEARRLAEEIFSSWERRPDPFARYPVPAHPPVERDQFMVVEQEVRTASALLSWHGPCLDQDMEGAITADVVAAALNHPSSRFHKALVDSGLATRAVFHYVTLKHVGPISLDLQGPPGKALAAVSRAMAELAELARPGYLRPEDLERAKRELITQDAFDREKTLAFANHLGFWWSVGGLKSYLEYPELVRQVGRAQVERFAQRYLPAGGARGAAALMVSRQAREAQNLTPGALEEAYRAGANPAGTAPQPGIAVRDLACGVRVLERVVDGAAVGAFGLYFRGHAQRNPVQKAGLEELLLRTLSEGLERDHAEELARLGARVRFRVEPDWSLLGVQCLREGLERAAELVVAALRRKELLPEAVERHRARMLDLYSRSLDNPDQAVGYLANRVFYPPGHPYLAYPGGTEESLRSLTLADLEARRQALLQGRLVLAVMVGEREAAGAGSLVERLLGDLPGVAPRGVLPPHSPRGDGGVLPPHSPRGDGGVLPPHSPRGDGRDVPPAGGAKERLGIEERPIPTSYILGRFAAPAPGDPDHEALALALSILHRKMFLEVRTKRALTYAVGSSLGERSRNTGLLYVTAQDPNLTLSTMYATLDSLVREPLPAEEFRGAVLTFATRHHLRRESAAEQADALALEELVAGDHRRLLDLQARLERLTPADVQRVLERYAREIHFGVLGPREQVQGIDRALFSRR